jgi:serine phosphatase RsbU (regulator of sigma subunit)/integral membrane sensor domain MASE1/anti-sigma regulatory factor (Ser/Thr protein kinase)
VMEPESAHPIEHRRGAARPVIEFVVLGVLYYLAARISLRIALVGDSITPLWPPTGIALVAFLRYGRRLWPAVAVAAFLVNLPLIDPAAALATAVGNTAAPLLVALLLERLEFRAAMDRARDVAALVGTALVGMTISATVGSLTLVMASEIPTHRFWTAWSVWWTGDAMGVLVVAPFLLALVSWPRRWTHVDRSAVLSALVLFSLLVGASLLAERTDGRFLFLIPPVVGWIAWRFQLRGAAPAVLLASGLAIHGAVAGTGWFADLSLPEAMLTLQLFDATIAFSAFFLSALVSDRIRAREALELAASQLEAQVGERTSQYRRQHAIADSMQEALLPQTLPDVHGVETAANYVPAEAGSTAGGDWYDVIPLSAGKVGLAIGDVGGHGLDAASVMGQLRMAARALALEGHTPADVVVRADRVLKVVAPDEIATMLYVEVDPEVGDAVMVSAGHPSPIAVNGRGARYLEPAVGPPIGILGGDHYEERTVHLEPNEIIVLYTDGLTDRRDVSLEEARERLLEAAGSVPGGSIEDLCGRLAALATAPAADDVAILAMRLLPADARRLILRFPAEPAQLAGVRRALGRWLRAHAVDPADVEDLVLALSEACTNAIKHAYGPGGGIVEASADVDGDVVEVEVRDFGHWRPKRGAGGGLGLGIIEASTEALQIDRRADGTSVRMRKVTRREVADELAR